MSTECQRIENIRRLRDAGVTSHNANLEVWDKRLFEAVAPGKAKYIGYDLWVQRLVEAVDVMGEGGVSPNEVAICNPLPLPRIAARSITACNSRMLPGQA